MDAAGLGIQAVHPAVDSLGQLEDGAGDLVIYDRDDPERWIQSDVFVDPREHT